MNSILQDLRYAVRMVTSRPGFTAVIILTMAIGIGANTAMFSVIHSVLLRPLPFEEPDQLVMVKETLETQEEARGLVSYPNFEDWRNDSRFFDGMAAIRSKSFTVTGADQPERINGARVSAEFFPLLRVSPALGRTFLPEEDRVGAEKVAVIADGLWQRRFGGDPDVLDGTLTLNGEPFRIVGVLPPGFRFPVVIGQAEVWTPTALVDELFLGSRGAHTFRVVARMKPDVTLQQASSDLSTIAQRLELDYPKSNADRGVGLVPLHEQVVGAVRPALMMLFGAVALVLLIACANIANLLLTQCAGRGREFAVRAAVGGGRVRLIRQLLTESALVGVLGGLLGIVMALWSLDAVVALMPADLPRGGGIAIDARVFGFAFALSLLTSLAFGLAPAIQATRVNLAEPLKECSRAMASATRTRLRNALIVGEVALSLVLLIGATLLMRSFHRLMSVEPGFEPNNLLTFEFSIPRTHATAVQRTELFEQVRERVETLPEVVSACANVVLPLTESGIGLGFAVQGHPVAEPGDQTALYGSISPNYFHTLGIPLLDGRTFTPHDTRNSPGVMVINEKMSRRYWPNGDAIGQRLRISERLDERDPDVFEIVGIVADNRESIVDQPEPYMYVPFRQQTWRLMTFAVRTEAPPASVTKMIRRELASMTPDIAPRSFKTLEQFLSETVAQRRFATIALSTYALVAFVLAMIGLYATLSHTVGQRTHEIGVRMALGAKRLDVIQLVLRQGLSLTGIGVCVGILVAAGVTRVLTSLLYGITPVDPSTFVGISLALVVTAALACFAPAHRAAKVDPMLALRRE